MSEVKESLLTSTLYEKTNSIHGMLGEHLMGLGLFSDKVKYKKFLTLQYYIYQDVQNIYSNLPIEKIILNLHSRNCFDMVKKDMKDLNVPLPQPITMPSIQNISSAIGMLYVIEGIKLNEKHLLHYVEMIGFSNKYGARHLQADHEEREKYWCSFKSAINVANIDISAALHGAEQAFIRIFSHVRRVTE